VTPRELELGYLATCGDAVRAVHEIDRLSGSACRRAFEQRVDARRMAVDYLELYRRVVPAG
jgi:hypothetical protein